MDVATTPDNLCIHCRKGRRAKGKRKLCSACYYNPAIREKYPTKAKPEEKLTPDYSLLAPLCPAYCVHAVEDGLCAICEKAQRATLPPLIVESPDQRMFRILFGGKG